MTGIATCTLEPSIIILGSCSSVEERSTSNRKVAGSNPVKSILLV